MDDKFNSTPMKDAAISMHELYETLKEAGFSRREALELVSKIMTSAISDAIRHSQDDQQ